jgi:hypothetical protein
MVIKLRKPSLDKHVSNFEVCKMYLQILKEMNTWMYN